MKAEEIKLHFQKLNEQKVQLALIDDADEKLTIANRQSDAMLKNVREGKFQAGVSISNYNECIKICDKIIQMSKELGINASQVLETKNIAVKNRKETQDALNKISNI